MWIVNVVLPQTAASKASREWVSSVGSQLSLRPESTVAEMNSIKKIGCGWKKQQAVDMWLIGRWEKEGIEMGSER